MAEATDSLSFLCWGGLLLLVILMKRDCRVVQSPSVDWDPGRAPLFYRDLRDVGFFLKEFIYLFERERDSQQEREPKQRSGRGRSRFPVEKPDEGLLTERCDHTLIRRQVLGDCATQALRVVGFLIFQPAFWGRGLPAGTQKTLFG